MNIEFKQSYFSAVVPAAGLSSRMGKFKPMLPYKSRSVIESTINSLFDGGVEDIVVVVGFNGLILKNFLYKKYQEKIINKQLIIAINNNFDSTDMLYSIKCGVRVLKNPKAFFVLPCDMPLVSKDTISHLIKEYHSGILFPIFDSKRSHPPLIDYALKDEILSFEGENGLRGFFDNIEDKINTVNVLDSGVRCDLDTLDDYNKLLKRMV